MTFPVFCDVFSPEIADFKKVLVVNRVEIAVRIVRALKELGIKAVCLCEKNDGAPLHIRLADEVYEVKEKDGKNPFLDAKQILEVAKVAKVDAIHPGYGFLSEECVFIKKVEESEIKFMGPSSKSVQKLGDKINARNLAIKAGLPVITGYIQPIKDYKEALHVADKIGYPIILKNAGGGGGRGIRIVSKREELKENFDRASSSSGCRFKNRHTPCLWNPC